ncbi:MAG: ATP-binding protein [Mucilaginibacter sp.]
MNTTDSALQFLAGGGENGALIRSYDWSKTSLGHPAEWPKSLKTCVRIILTSRQPMFVWWGKDLINIYNDAYQAIVGGKHPWALGQPAREVWKEIWNEVEPRAGRALNKNEGTYDESLLLIMERNGYPEETYYTFSYSPVPGDNDEPEGIICANTDDTDRIINERQLRTLKDLGKAYIDSTSNKEIYDKTLGVLRENPMDFPFALIYECVADSQLKLAGSSVKISEKYAPLSIDLTGLFIPWNLDETFNTHTNQIIAAEDDGLPTGAWPIPPKQVLVLPIAQAGQPQAYGAMVVGINPYRLLDERYLGFFNLVADQVATGISAVRIYEEEQKRIAALLEIDKAKTVFFNNVSHEFRTPLTLMLGPVEELIKYQDDKLPAAFKENTQSIYRNAQRLLKLVNSLLEFSRIEAGRVQASYRPVNLPALTADLASGFRSIIEKAGLKFEVDCPPSKTLTYLDHEMWEKIVLNLLSNAFKYTLTGSIRLSLKERRNEVVLQVSDTGVGIPGHELPHMFERFHRVPGSAGRTHEGTGIGLSLINELVKMHHGEITVASEEGKGSIFTVKIPAGKAHLPPDQVSEAGGEFLESSLTSAFIDEAASLLNGDSSDAFPINESEEVASDKSARILVADDNADMRAYLKRILEPHFSVSAVANGKEALESLHQVKPDLLISDVMMPVMDGQELVQAIRADIHTLRIPVILLSARAGEEARIEGLEAGADDYLVKPFSAKELLTKVRSHITIGKARNHTEELLRQLFINAPVAIAIFRGPQLIIELANPLMLEIWDRGSDEVVNLPVIKALPELEGQDFELLMKEVYDTGRRYVSSEREVTLIRNSRLQKIYVTFIYEPLRESDGTVSGVISLAHEITDLIEARSRAQESADEMRQLVKQKDEFLSIASHELKTPITSMKAFLQVLERMKLPNEQAANFIVKATRQVNRLSALVTDLLDVSSLQAGKMKFYFETFRLKDMLTDVIEQYQQSEHHHIILEDSPDIQISGDRNRLEQVLSNFISNAIKYSPDADKVIVNATLTSGELKITVADFGIGIPAAKMPYVFERFFRVEESSMSFSGLGLGLYISAEIVKRHRGKIGLEKNGTKGTIFWFILPLSNSPEILSAAG